jgi:hypothetical protein
MTKNFIFLITTEKWFVFYLIFLKQLFKINYGDLTYPTTSQGWPRTHPYTSSKNLFPIVHYA